jgi:two-component system nitrate/nitrite response regulator NarL
MQQVVTPVASSPLDVLTPRELEVLKLISDGQSNKAIARKLDLSIGTVKGHVSAILTKLEVTSRTQAALLAVDHGLQESVSR